MWDSVDYIYINGDNKLSLNQDGEMTWHAVLRHFPGVRNLHVGAPTPAALAPLCDAMSLPGLGNIWLTAGTEGGRTCEVDAAWLLEVCERRKELQAGSGPSALLRLHDNLRVFGHSDVVCRLRGFSDRDLFRVPSQTIVSIVDLEK